MECWQGWAFERKMIQYFFAWAMKPSRWLSGRKWIEAGCPAQPKKRTAGWALPVEDQRQRAMRELNSGQSRIGRRQPVREQPGLCARVGSWRHETAPPVSS